MINLDLHEPLDWTLGLDLTSHSTERVFKPDNSMFMLEKSVHGSVNVYLNILWNVFGLLFPRKLALSVFVIFHISVNIFLKAVLNDECVWQIICCCLFCSKFCGEGIEEGRYHSWAPVYPYYRIRGKAVPVLKSSTFSDDKSEHCPVHVSPWLSLIVPQLSSVMRIKSMKLLYKLLSERFFGSPNVLCVF